MPRDGAHEVREYLGTATRAPSSDDSVTSNPRIAWRASLGRGTVGAAAIGERVSAVATVDRFVYAFDTRTGQPFWRYRGEGPFGAGPAMSGGRIVAASEGHDGTLAAIDVFTGKRLWRRSIGDVAAPLAIADGAVYGATQADGLAFAVAVADGRVLWRRRTGPSRAGPLVVGRYVTIATLTDTLVILDRFSGATVTFAALGASSIAPLARANDSTAVLASPAGIVMAITVPSGRVQWRVGTGEAVAGAPAIARDTVFALTNGCELWMIPLAAPDEAAAAPLDCVASTGPLVVRGGVLVATIGGEVVLFDRRSRTRLWSRHLGSEIRHPPIVLNGQVVVAPSLGNVVSLR
ncbi:MAG: PQQ-like beta-propeller repeat protein [Gemmatimonadota bacterium]|nr:PQQ-like beta-propeller repeat protein [Gemmatimonadota bacterium]